MKACMQQFSLPPPFSELRIDGSTGRLLVWKYFLTKPVSEVLSMKNEGRVSGLCEFCAELSKMLPHR